MKTLCMDTSHRYLVLVLIEDDKIVASYQEVAWKKQSELIFMKLIALMEQAQWSVDDIHRVIITKGPGSYTGVRIAMSIAKVLCTRKKIALYTLSTLQLYAGLKDTYVMLDARSARAYFGNCKEGELLEEMILTLDEIKKRKDKSVIGDSDLIEVDPQPIDFAANFLSLQTHAQLVSNIHTLTPEYLKDESAYLGK
ncbi:MAG: tRNA (adenosine(37)-N6)-threonylcarbamoyltransferase complex dimerization subunit type 1 TsaB [Erysipelotrichia bacterium]|nr:tRNA (adenosine(37)-N6)-threonylcarbamoyltransferase complex dimerization subunit type 1 TsaB [Erysipelotrichia bacterium]NCC55380.1 tRNA (adenosine(37)-N6)-threonylcarbamoyltransferase complex dimerization subunit type 1 TsaB [Erysipelotrichia bacterium]